MRNMKIGSSFFHNNITSAKASPQYCLFSLLIHHITFHTVLCGQFSQNSFILNFGRKYLGKHSSNLSILMKKSENYKVENHRLDLDAVI